MVNFRFHLNLDSFSSPYPHPSVRMADPELAASQRHKDEQLAASFKYQVIPGQEKRVGWK